MERFTKRYLVNIVILFGLLYLDISPISNVVNSMQIDLISNILSLIIDHIEQNRVVITEHYSPIIEEGFVIGIDQVYFYTLQAQLLGMDTTIIYWQEVNIGGIYLGYIIRVTLGGIIIFRNIFDYRSLVMIDRSNFYLAHKYIWKYTPIHNSYNGAINLFFQL